MIIIEINNNLNSNNNRIGLLLKVQQYLINNSNKKNKINFNGLCINNKTII